MIIDKNEYYGSTSEAVGNFGVLSLCFLYIICLVGHTFYKFFCENMNYDKKSKTKSKPFIRRVRSDKCEYVRLNMDIILTPLAVLTSIYLIFVFLYASSKVITNYWIIFGYWEPPCILNELLGIIPLTSRLLLYYFFGLRLHIVFNGSFLEYSKSFLKILGIIITFSFILATVFFELTMNIQKNEAKSDGDKCGNAELNYYNAAAVPLVVDILINLTLLHLFISGLARLFKQEMKRCTEMQNKQGMKQAREMIKLMTKLTLLVCVAVIGEIILFIVLLNLLPGTLISVIDCLCATCLVWTYNYHSKNYKRYCGPCRACCMHGCMWWFINSGECCQMIKSGDLFFKNSNANIKSSKPIKVEMESPPPPTHKKTVTFNEAINYDTLSTPESAKELTRNMSPITPQPSTDFGSYIIKESKKPLYNYKSKSDGVTSTTHNKNISNISTGDVFFDLSSNDGTNFKGSNDAEFEFIRSSTNRSNTFRRANSLPKISDNSSGISYISSIKFENNNSGTPRSCKKPHLLKAKSHHHIMPSMSQSMNPEQSRSQSQHHRNVNNLILNDDVFRNISIQDRKQFWIRMKGYVDDLEFGKSDAESDTNIDNNKVLSTLNHRKRGSTTFR